MRRRKQRGVALILLVTVLVLGIAWFAVGALGKAAPSTAERELKSGEALRAAKQAVLGYVAHYAARTSSTGWDQPGQMPCPESVNSIGTLNEGLASGACSNITASAGRLPWRTLGIDQLRDGDGEPLWFVLSPGFRAAPMNFGTPGQLPYNGLANAAVALIIAPGGPVNTLSDPAAPPAGCSKVRQQVSTRYTAPLAVANFLECGNASGNYASLGSSQWSNDRVIVITAAEWADAIAPAIADRLQRQVAPALEEWRSTQASANWGISFLPYASSFGTPSTNDYCGDANVHEGLPPIASFSSATCSTSWTAGSVTFLLGTPMFPGWCGSGATEMTCVYIGTSDLAGLLSAHITATGPGVANSFRAKIGSADITITNSSPVGSGTVSNFSLTLDPASGNATVGFDVSQASLPALSIGWVIVTVKNLPDAPILSDSRLSWFIANNWHQYTYYAISQAVTANPSGTCAVSGDPQCLQLNGVRDKRLLLTLMGPRAVGTQTQPSALPADYLESHTAGTTAYASQTVTKTFNDRLAGCPFQYAGAAAATCN